MEGSGDTAPLAESASKIRPAFSLALRWVTEPDRCEPILSSPVIVGRDRACGLVIDSAGVSRRHAELTRDGPALVVRDLLSRNGTFLNGRQVELASPKEGDLLRFGDSLTLVVRTTDQPQPVALSEIGETMLVGPDSRAMFAQLRHVAGSDLPIVINGETGVGKERVARAIHALSRRTGNFHGINCAALPTSLAEAELFGYRKGAFSGAEGESLGHLRAAHGGTLLLDELAELSPTVQAKLLRALQEKEVVPLGQTRAVPIDVRVVAACQVPLEQLVKVKRVRQDLAARLSGAVFEIAPLRARRLDVAFLFAHFLRRFADGTPPKVDARLVERLLLYPWPSNVRELELLVRRLVVLHGGEPLLTDSMLPEALGRSDDHCRGPTAPTQPPPDRDTHDLLCLQQALVEKDGNVSRAAAQVGISRQRAYRLMGAQRFGTVESPLDESGSNRPSDPGK